jgi:acetyl-CoA carboxylase carboxyl transferase subunit alpha
MEYTLDFEKPLVDLEDQISILKNTESAEGMDFDQEIKSLEAKLQTLSSKIYKGLDYWQKVQLSRHPKRPHAIDYIETLIEDFHEIAGDRAFGNDQTIITGFGKLHGQKVLVIGIEKGRKTPEKIKRNFGMPNPEGYRKVYRALELAGRFSIPVVSFVDTPGAYPGLGAEQRGQAHAIANNLELFFSIRSPIIAVVIGEGGSGGALGVAVADKVMMMEYSIYSVISPESCASILWSDAGRAQEAAKSLKLGANKALELEVIDSIIPEVLGGAQKDADGCIKKVGLAVSKELKALKKIEIDKLLELRFTKFRNIGNKFIQ